MFFRAGRIVLAAVFSLFLSSGASRAAATPAGVATHTGPSAAAPTPRVATPFDRYMRPLVEKARANSKSKSAHGAATQSIADTTLTASPNFGGYLNATSYPARAATSAQYDPLNNGVGAVLTADFDKDGHPDLLVMQYDGTLNVLLNSGSGAFSAPISYLNQGPNIDDISISQAFTADLNSDGYLDLVAYDPNNYQVLTWLNNGDGSFKQPQIFVLNSNLGTPAGVAIGDVNGDGKPDVVAAYSTFLSRTSGTLAIQPFLGKGDGTFSTSAAGQTFNFPTSAAQLPGTNPIALGDLNGDGKLDLAIANVGQTSQTTATLSVFTAVGNGNGTFGALSTNPVISADFSGFILQTSGVEILDVNNDGKLDIAADLGTNNVYAALGNGQGTFASQVSSPFQSSSGTVFADMNGDGFPDAITEGNGNVGIFLGKGNGTFSTPPLDTYCVTDLFNGPGIATADFNGDGKVDLAKLSAFFFEVEVFAGNGDGSLQGARALSVPDDFMPNDNTLLGVVNANGDAYSDVLLENFLNTPTLYTGLSDGKGGFKYVASLSGALPSNFSEAETFQADFNGDGKQDLILTGSTGQVWTALSNGNGTFAALVAINMPTLACPVSGGAAGDLNGDGKTDLVIAYPGDAACGGSTVAPGYFVIKGNGNGTFQTPTFYPAGAELYSATLADVNQDGNLDLLLNDEPDPTSNPDQITLQLGNGDGSFGASSTVLANYIVTDLRAVDINQDGKPDLVLAAEELDGTSTETGGIILISGNGDGTFGATSQIAAGNYFDSLQVADVNGDGIPDIEAILAGTVGEPNTYLGFTTLLGTGEGSFSSPYNEPVSPAGGLLMTGRFLSDNTLDVVLQSQGGISLFLNQGGTAVALSGSSASINAGQSETLTAAVTATMSGRPAPTGTVSFYDGSALLGVAPVTSGSATFTAGNLAVGTHSFTSSYSGDTNFNPNTSAATSATVNSLAPAFTLSGTPGTLTLQQGANGTVVLSLAANATFSGPITLSCSGAPTNATCSFDNTTVNLTAGSTATATLIVGTTGTLSAAHTQAVPWERTAGIVSLAGLAGCFWSRRRQLRYLNALGAVLFVIAVFGMSGCSGNSSKTTPVTASSPGAPVVSTGSYTITVTASATGSSAPAQTATVAVTVQ